MVYDLTPWAGHSQTSEAEKAQPAPVDRRRPQEEQALRAAEVLAGLRGDDLDRAVTFRDLERFKESTMGRIAAAETGIDGEIGKAIKGQFAVIDSESKALVDKFNKTFDDITDEVSRLDAADAALSISFNQQIGNVTADLEQNYYTIAGTDSAIAAVQTLLESSIGSVSANLSANYYTRASTDSAIATAVNTLSTTVNGNTASITSLSASIDGVEATYGVRINNNGHISGFSLISTAVAGGAQSNFIIVDSSFRVVNTSGAGNYTPLAVYPTGRTVDGAFVPAGVHAQDLYVTRANIASLAVDSAKIANAAITSAKIGSLQVQSANIDNLTVGGEKITDFATSNVGSGAGVGSQNIPASWTVITSFTFSTVGSKTIHISAMAKAINYGGGAEGDEGRGNIRIRSGGFVSHQANDASGDVPLLGVATSSAGSTTVYLEAQKASGNGDYGVSGRMVAVELRK